MFRLLVDAGANVNATVPVKRYTGGQVYRFIDLTVL
jgi:hypothetical protein